MSPEAKPVLTVYYLLGAADFIFLSSLRCACADN